MGKFDEVVDKVKDVVNAAGKKTGEFVEVSKYKLRATTINGDIDKIYKRIGVVVYEARKNHSDSEALVDSCIAEIDELIQELREIQGKIDGIRTANKCRACGFENVDEAQYCASCGAPLHRAAQAAYEEGAQEPQAEAAQGGEPAPDAPPSGGQEAQEYSAAAARRAAYAALALPGIRLFGWRAAKSPGKTETAPDRAPSDVKGISGVAYPFFAPWSGIWERRTCKGRRRPASKTARGGVVRMARKGEQNYLRGAVVLGAAAILVKLIGACFKIPLMNLLGGVGMGDFMSAYTIFNPIYSLAIAGLPVAVSKMVSEAAALGRYRDMRKIMRVSTLLFIGTGLLGSGVMLLGAPFFARWIENADGALAIAAMGPAVLFCCLLSAVRGYYQGIGNMRPTALSQILEAVVKLVCGMLFSYLLIEEAARQYAATGQIFGHAAEDAVQAQVLAAQFAAVGAVLGVVASTAASTLFLWGYHWIRGDGIGREQLRAAPIPQRGREILRRMVRIAVPVCLAAVVVHLTSLIDLVSIMNRLTAGLERDAGALLAGYGEWIPKGYDHGEIAKFLFGSYNGIAVTLFNIVPAFTTTLGISVLPAISAAWAVHSRALVKRHVESVLRITALVALPAGFGFMALAEPICLLLYAGTPQEAMIAAPLLRMMGLGVAFVAMTSPVNSVLQAVGSVSTPVKLLAVGGAIKLATNYILVGIPAVNIHGAPVGTILCYGTILLLSFGALERVTGVELSYLRVFGRTAFCAALCGLAAWASYGLLSRLWESRLVTLGAIAIAGAVYILALLCVKALYKEDIIMLPGGEKVVKALEKYAVFM